MIRFAFTSTEDLQERVLTALDDAEKRARARTLPRDYLEELFSFVADRPWGYAKGDGGHVPRSYFGAAETTHFVLAWYSWRGQKHIALDTYRGYAKKVPYGSLGCLSLEAGDREDAYGIVLPDRAKRFREIMKRRRIRAATRHLPPLPAGTKGVLLEVFPDIGGLVVAKTTFSVDGLLIGTPTGWLRAPNHPDGEKRPAWNYLMDMGFPVPHRKKNRVWNDEMAAFAALYVLGGE